MARGRPHPFLETCRKEGLEIADGDSGGSARFRMPRGASYPLGGEERRQLAWTGVKG